MLIGIPRLDGSDSTEDLADGVAAAVAQVSAHYGDRAAPAVRMLPSHLERSELVRAAYQHRTARPNEVAVGVDEAELAPMFFDFASSPHFLVFGDTESGKTNLLRTVLAGLMETGTPDDHRILVLDYRRTLLGEVDKQHQAGYASSAQAVAPLIAQLVDILTARGPGPDATPQQLRDRSWWSGPDIYVVVDDYDMVAVASGNPLLPLVEFLAQGRDIGFHLILARRSGGASRTMYDPIIARLRDLTSDGLVLSASKEEGILLGTQKCTPRVPGRGLYVSRSRGEGLIQVAWTEPTA